jgi:hypothetical protein
VSKSLEGVICLCILFDIEAPSLNGMILNAALMLLFYICGHGFLFESSSIGNPQYAPEVWYQTPGTLCIYISSRYLQKNVCILNFTVFKNEYLRLCVLLLAVCPHTSTRGFKCPHAQIRVFGHNDHTHCRTD